MSDQDDTEPECTVCGSLNGLTFVVLTKRPLKADEDFETDNLHIVCRDHWNSLVEGDEYHVREVPPIPSKRGGFTRNEDEEGDILYDGEISESCWIRFNPDNDEVDLGDSERKREKE